MAEEAKYDQQNIEKKSDHGVTGPVKIGEHAAAPPVETTDRGLFNFKGKKDGDKKCEEEVTATPSEEKKHETLLQKIHQSGNAPIDHGGEKIEKKHQDTSVPIEIKEKYDGIPPAHEETAEKKGFLDKIKEKLPGGQKKEGELDQAPAPPPPQVSVDYGTPDGETKEKKGFVTKIKDKLPGNHSKTEDQEIKEKI